LRERRGFDFGAEGRDVAGSGATEGMGSRS